ncbi:MAG: hypothetical protein K0R34_1366 [Herbinix sp.]|jgi:hypothetical protein|nr:hypothetical protein [Herbinix sp.]
MGAEIIEYIQEIVLFIILSEMFFWQRVTKQFKDKHFVLKKITDTIRLLLLYYWCIYYFNKVDFEWSNILWMLIPSIIILLFYCLGIKTIMMNKPSKVDSKIRFSIIISMLLAIIVYFASLNFCLYYLDVNAYSTLDFTEWYKIAFEFLYYSFSVSITFGGGSIDPISISAKALVMLQIIMFYYIIGQGISDYFINGRKLDDTNKEK